MTGTVSAGIVDMPNKAMAILDIGVGGGRIAMLEMMRPMKVRKGQAEIMKWSQWQVRIGCNYENLAAVKEARQDGTLPEEPHGISGGEWAIFPLFVRYIKTGQWGLRVYSLPNGKGFPPKYFRGGIEITENEAMEACLASEFAERGENPGMCYAPKIDNIISINGIKL
jgi:hypothetical protein